MTRILTLLITISIFTTKAQKTLDLYSIATDYSLYPLSASNIAWIPSTTKLAYSLDAHKLELLNIPSFKKQLIISLSQLNYLIDSLRKIHPINKFTLHYLPTLIWIDQFSFTFNFQRYYFLYNLHSRKLTLIHQLPEKAESPDFCKENLLIAYLYNNNLYILQNGEEIAVTKETNPNIRMCNFVHREEFGIKKGTFWSPKGNYLAFYRMDETDVTNYPLIDITQRIATVIPEKYPMVGMNSHYVTLGIYDINKKQTIYVQTGEPRDQYLTSVTWSPDEKFIYIGLLNREQNYLKVNQYSAITGALVKTLFEETSTKYVEPLHQLYFIPGNNNEFLWLSQRDGYSHIYHYNTNGQQLRQITRGKWVVRKILGFDHKGQYVFIEANKETPIEWHLYKVRIKDGYTVRFTSISGVHEGMFDYTGKYCFSQFSNLHTPAQLSVFDEKGTAINTIHKSSNPLKNYSMPQISIFSIFNSEGIELFCRLITPPQMQSDRKYPLILYVYGGPHSQLITNSWLGNADLFLIYLAQKGYIVFSLDNRGTAYRGFEFESAIFRNLGKIESIDQMEGIRYLTKKPFIDTNRIGVYGWSYGGYMAIRLMLDYPEIFKIGVAGGPVCDWKYYEIMYGERYMGTPQNNPIGYEETSLLNKISNLKGHLLIIHGAIDPIVVWQHSLLLLEHSINAKKHIDYFVYPTDKHGVKWQNIGHLYEKIYLYFKKFL